MEVLLPLALIEKTRTRQESTTLPLITQCFFPARFMSSLKVGIHGCKSRATARTDQSHILGAIQA